MIISPISVVVSSRSVASCTTPSISSTIASNFGVATGRFSQAFNSPCRIFWRFKHSRRRRIVSPVRPSRESITLSSRFPQKGHFTPAFLPCRLFQHLVQHFRARQCHRALLFRVPPIPAIYPERLLRGSVVEFPQYCRQQKPPTTTRAQRLSLLQSQFQVAS